MAIYIITILFLGVLAYIYDVRDFKKNRDIWINVVVIWLICLAGFRYRIGTDSAFYEYEFASFPDLLSLKPGDITQSRYAPLYVLLTSFVRTLTDQFFVMQFIISAAINISIFRFVRKYINVKYIFTFAIFYFCSFYYNLNCETLRETLAISIFLFSADYYLEKKWLRYYICVLFAILFHYSAIVLIFIPLLYKVRINKSFGIFVAILLASYPIIRLVQIDVIIENMFSIMLIFPDIAAEYLDKGLNENDIGINTFVTQLIMPLFFTFYLRYKNKDKEWGRAEYMMVLYLITTWMAAIFQAMFSRYNNYFGIVYYAYYAATVVELTKNLGKQSLVAFVILFVPFAFTTHNYWTNAYIHEMRSSSKRIELIDPYSSVFSKEKNNNRENIYIELYKY